MPILDNPRHERFAQALAKGMSQIEAYKAAGYKPDDGAASRLSGNVRVQARVAELQDRAAIRTEVTIESLTRELEEAQKLARETGQPGAFVAAVREKAVLHGLRVEKSERRTGGLDDLNADERDRLRDVLRGELAGRSGGTGSVGQAGPPGTVPTLQ